MNITLHRDDDALDVPARLPVLPLRDVVIFPYTVTPLLVGRAGSLAAIEEAMAGDGFIALVTQRASEATEPSSADLFRVGVVARVLQAHRLPNGTTRVLVEALGRARVARFASTAGGLLRATVTAEALLRAPRDDEEAAARRALERFEEYVGLQRRLPGEVLAMIQGAESLERRAYGMAAHVGARVEVRQKLLESKSLIALCDTIADTLSGELELLRLERKIEDEVKGSLFQNQREFYLQEQLKVIHRELGQDDDDLAELETQIAQRPLPDLVRARGLREVRKLRRMTPLSPEATVSRNFIDWILALPWRERTDDVIDVAHARRVLDEDHHGLEEVKDRILDYIAVISLVGSLDGPILCLVGPPGVGKTSLGRSVARALGRKFVRMSLGGVRDEAEIRGHRRTYIGAMPGRVIQAMRRAEVVNPVILLDEIDKLGQDWRGDPAAALLEVLDPEQNRAFNDHYLELDYDLSQVLFVTTANTLGAIPEPLRDRMEVIRLPGYVEQEKLAIAQQFLVPRQLKKHGIAPESVVWESDVIPAVIHNYTREAGVRELERRVSRIARKIARRRVEGGGISADVQVLKATDIRDLLGIAPYDPEALTLDDKVGVAAGLAYTPVGGEVLEIEVNATAGRGRLQLTGTLGDVMKESATAAASYVRARAAALGIERDFPRARDMHVHIPAGATPKDGPSAGIAIAVALVSALTGVPVRGDVAMTGEITLRGRVLPIGGLKEKSVAALRNNVAHVVIPKGNAREVEELPAEVRAGVTFHPVATMDEVLTLALRGDPFATAPAVRPAVREDKQAAAARGVVAH